MGVAAGGSQEATIQPSTMGAAGTPTAPPSLSPEAATGDAISPKGTTSKAVNQNNLPLDCSHRDYTCGYSFILLKPDGEGKVDKRVNLLPHRITWTGYPSSR